MQYTLVALLDRTGTCGCFRFRFNLSVLIVFSVSSLSESEFFRVSSSLITAQMYRAPVRPQRSPGAPRPAGRFPSPASCWGFPGARSPFTGSGHRGASVRGCPSYSPGSLAYSPGSDRGYRDRSPAGFGSGSRGFGGQMQRRGDGYRRPQPFSPNFQVKFEKSSNHVKMFVQE